MYDKNVRSHALGTSGAAGFFPAALDCQQQSRALLIFVNYRLLGCDWCEVVRSEC